MSTARPVAAPRAPTAPKVPAAPKGGAGSAPQPHSNPGGHHK
jgi:hypothetical protein